MARARPSLAVMALAAALLVLASGPAAAAAASSSSAASSSHGHTYQHRSHHERERESGTAKSQRLPLAHMADDTGLAFSGSGFLAVFHLGALRALRELGLATQATRVAGTSGGSLVSGISCLGVSQEDAWGVAQKINDDCRGEWSCAGQLDRAVKAAMRQAVGKAMAAAGLSPSAPQPERDAFVRKQCAGRATFNMSLVDGAEPAKQALKSAVSWPVSNFTNEDDFTRAGAASAYIPAFSGGQGKSWHTEFRGSAVVDGMFSSGLPPKCVARVDQCVSIKAVTKGGGPDEPADIAPGKYSPLPDGLTPDEWQRHALIAPNTQLAKDMEQHGFDEAMAWACKAHRRSMEGSDACKMAAGGKKAATTTAPKEPKMMPRKMIAPHWQVPALG